MRFIKGVHITLMPISSHTGEVNGRPDSESMCWCSLSLSTVGAQSSFKLQQLESPKIRP